MKRKIIFILCLLVCSIFSIANVNAAGPAENGVIIVTPNGDDEDDIIIYDEGITYNNAISGVTYDLGTNTLTIKNFSGNYHLDIESMGDDFVLNVLGVNDFTNIWLDGSETNVTFTGDGSLILNKAKEDIDPPIYSRTGGVFTFEDSISLFLYTKESTCPEIPTCVINNFSIGSSDVSKYIIFKGDIKPEVKTRRHVAYLGTKLLSNSFGILPESAKYYKVATINSKKYAYEVGSDNKVTVYTTELTLDTYSNKLFLGFKDDIMSQKTVYDNVTAAEADYTLTEDKAYVGHYKYVYSLFQDSSGNQYAISNDDDESFGSYYVFNITDKKITIGDKELTYLEYNPDVLYSSLEGVPDYEEQDEWDHYVGGTELIIDRTKKSNNPKTSDDAINYIVITIIFSLGLIYTLRKEN